MRGKSVITQGASFTQRQLTRGLPTLVLPVERIQSSQVAPDSRSNHRSTHGCEAAKHAATIGK